MPDFFEFKTYLVWPQLSFLAKLVEDHYCFDICFVVVVALRTVSPPATLEEVESRSKATGLAAFARLAHRFESLSLQLTQSLQVVSELFQGDLLGIFRVSLLLLELEEFLMCLDELRLNKASLFSKENVG